MGLWLRSREQGVLIIAEASTLWDPVTFRPHSLTLNFVTLEDRRVGSKVKGSGGGQPVPEAGYGPLWNPHCMPAVIVVAIYGVAPLFQAF